MTGVGSYGGRVLIVGLGDLGRRLTYRLVSRPELNELILAGRDPGAGKALAALAAACGEVPVTFREVDAVDKGSVVALLKATEPDLVVQCASNRSHWRVASCEVVSHGPLDGAGFAMQLPFQLLPVHTLMSAVRATRYAGSVVNCSFPDVTHAVLGQVGLEPLTGIGNVGMIQAWVEAELRRRGSVARIRVVAHHAMTRPVLTSTPVSEEFRPWVFVGDERRDNLAFAGPPIVWGAATNELTAATAEPVLAAIAAGRALRTSLPGPLGLPGGYPVILENGAVRLDLPPGLSEGAAVAQNERAATLDGVASIGPDGTTSFTPTLRSKLAALDPELAQPLGLHDLPRRAALLASALGLD